MTLRLRLALALVALVACGLAAFGVITYQLYARSLYERLDLQAHAATPFMSRLLDQRAGLQTGFVPFGGATVTNGGPTTGTVQSTPPSGPQTGIVSSPFLPIGSYGQLRSSTGEVLASYATLGTTSRPALPTTLPAATGDGAFTVGSSTGSGTWRVVTVPARLPTGGVAVVAVPTTEVDAALQRLLLIEAAGDTVLLALLTIGSWLILRRGLRPLERMAATARTIRAGDLTPRVEPGPAHTEITELGEAFNEMLDDIELGFLEREATEQRLRQFLADASHELRTPLTSIQGFAELFHLGAQQKPADLEIVMHRITQEAERMRGLVEDLLLLARLDQAPAMLRDEVDLTTLAADACTDAAAVDRGRPLTLDAPHTVTVWADEGQLRQAIGNLVRNAVVHTPPGTPVRVSVRAEGPRAIVEVTDAGPGLDDAALAHAFDRFWRADPARSGTGSGLGLAIVAGIAAAHGGTVSAANASPGPGARFTLRLPRHADDARDDARGQDEDEPKGTTEPAVEAGAHG